MIIKTIYFVIVFIIPSAVFADSSDWRFLGSSSMSDEYYNIKTIEKYSNAGKVWTKSIYTKNGTAETVKVLGKKYKNVFSSLSNKYIDCANRKISLISTVYYSINGSVVDSFDYENDMESINVPPDSMGDTLLNIVCN